MAIIGYDGAGKETITEGSTPLTPQNTWGKAFDRIGQHLGQPNEYVVSVHFYGAKGSGSQTLSVSLLEILSGDGAHPNNGVLAVVQMPIDGLEVGQHDHTLAEPIPIAGIKVARGMAPATVAGGTIFIDEFPEFADAQYDVDGADKFWDTDPMVTSSADDRTLVWFETAILAPPGEAPEFDDPGYDNAASYYVGAPVELTPAFATPADPSIEFSITGGALPSALSLDTETGEITGTLDTAESVSFEVTATNAEGADAFTVAFTVASLNLGWISMQPFYDSSGSLRASEADVQFIARADEDAASDANITGLSLSEAGYLTVDSDAIGALGDEFEATVKFSDGENIVLETQTVINLDA